MDWKVNTCNLNHLLFDKDGVIVTDAMKQLGSSISFYAMHQETAKRHAIAEMTFEECMEWYSNSKYAKVHLPEK